MKPSKTREVLLSGTYDFTAPNFIGVEIFKHYPKILKYSVHDSVELIELYRQISGQIEFINPSKISLGNRQAAYDLTFDIDLKGMVYVALSLEVNGDLWTGDMQLKQGLIRKGFDRFFEIHR
ncbi:MAG: PIN domain-containing protein [Saprospiraceae bacterium]